MAKTLRVRTKNGWVTKPLADIPANSLSSVEVDDNFLELESFQEKNAQSIGLGIYNYGPLSADPITRPDGSPLVKGDEYHNTVTGKRRQFDGVVWNDFIGVSAGDLGNVTDPARGAAFIGRGWQAARSIADLRHLKKDVPAKYAEVFGYYSVGDGGGGLYYLDESDTSSADNGGSIIVASDGGRWKLNHRGEVSVRQFGARSDSVASQSSFIQSALSTGIRRIVVPDGTYMIDAVGAPLQPENYQEISLSDGAVLKAMTASTGNYSIILAESRTGVRIVGGRILGERTTHIGTAGEFGMGVRFNACISCSITDTVIEDCWGDGIYIGSDGYGNRNPCLNIRLTRVVSRNNRRNNLSVINSIGLRSSHCSFDDANGVSPQAGVDLEPNDASEQVSNTLFAFCSIGGNAGAGMMTAGPLTASKDLYVVSCRFKNNSYNFFSGITNTQVFNSDADGSSNTTADAGGFSIVDGVISGCVAKNFRRTGFGATGTGNVVVENCETKYLAKNGGTEEDTFLYCTKTGGSLIIRGNTARGRSHCIRGNAGTLDYLEITGNTFERYHSGSFGTAYPLRIDSIVSTRDAVIRNNTFGIPAGTATDGIVIIQNPNTNYLLENNNVKGWNRTRTNWYSQAAGTGTTRFGSGNVLPSGEFGREQSWQTGYIQFGTNVLWVDDDSGRLRIKSSAPSSDTDGTVVGAQS